MTIELLRTSLAKGEKNEKADERVIEITESDNGGMKPDVYLGIYKTVGKKQKQVIIEDFFLPTDLAIKIGKALIQQALDIEKDKGTLVCLKYLSPAEKKEFKKSSFYKFFSKDIEKCSAAATMGFIAKKVKEAKRAPSKKVTNRKAGIAKKKSKGELVLPPQKIGNKLVKGLTKTSLKMLLKNNQKK